MFRQWRECGSNYDHGEATRVQVFATTHSDDCLRGLAQVIKRGGGGTKEIALHRLERDNPHSVHYSAEEIVLSAEKSIEVR